MKRCRSGPFIHQWCRIPRQLLVEQFLESEVWGQIDKGSWESLMLFCCLCSGCRIRQNCYAFADVRQGFHMSLQIIDYELFVAVRFCFCVSLPNLRHAALFLESIVNIWGCVRYRYFWLCRYRQNRLPNCRLRQGRHRWRINYPSSCCFPSRFFKRISVV